MKIIRLTFLIVLLFSNCFTQTNATINDNQSYYFIVNKGQWPAEVLYLTKIDGMNAWITKTGVVYDYYKIERNYTEDEAIILAPNEKEDFERNNTSIAGHVIKMNLVNAKLNPEAVANNKQETYYNYFIGNDESKWASNVGLYEDIEINEVYEGIGIKYYFDEGLLRYDYHIKPNADLSQLKFDIEGQDGLSINDKGELVIETSLGEVTHGKLYAYQENKEVECGFQLNTEGTLSVVAKNYDQSKELVIDPLVYSTFLGGSDRDFLRALTRDASNNVYVAGWTKSSDFPTTPGAYQTSYGGSDDAFVTKLNSDGTALVYSTFLGGSSNAFCNAIATDVSNNVYVTGQTNSSDFPTTPGAYQTSYSGSGDAFITKLNGDGTTLVYSTFLGGSTNDYTNALATDVSNNVYVAGSTRSSDFPTTPGAYQTSFNGSAGNDDAFITKLNSDGTALVYSTFLGGSRGETALSLSTDVSNNVYVAGQTNSSDFPTTPGAYQTSINGSDGYLDAFVTKLNSGGTALVYSTFLGGSDDDRVYALSMDASKNVYVAGQTNSSDFPTTAGAYQTSINGRGGFYEADAFVTKLNSGGTALVYSTYLGGSSIDYAQALATDALNNAYVAGYAWSSDFPTTPGAYQTSSEGFDAFITKLNSEGTALVYSTYLVGGNIYALSTDASNNVYVAGETNSSDFPTTPGAFQTSPGGNTDAFVTSIELINETLEAPSLISPSNNIIGSSINPAFNWTDVENAESYTLQSATDSLFNDLVIQISPIFTSEYQLTDYQLNYNTKYYWKIRGFNSNIDGEWSDVWNFQTMLNTPELASPQNSSTNVSLSPSLSWTEINGADNYFIELSQDETFSSNIIFQDSAEANSIAINGLIDNEKYFWRIQAFSNSGNFSEISEIFSFTTVQTQLDPTINGSVGVPTDVTINWYSTEGATDYHLEVNTQEDFNGDVIVDNPTLTDTSFSLTELQHNTTYYWRVSADSKNNNTVMTSEVYNFTTKLDTPDLISPINNTLAASLTPTLNWSAIEGTDYYQYQVSSESTFVDNIIADDTTENNSIIISNLTDNSKYYWRVIAHNNSGNQSEVSEVFNFMTQQTVLKPTLNNSVGVPLNVDLLWYSTEGANSYHVEVNLDEGFDGDIIVDESVSDTLYSLSDLAYNTTHYWRVSAFSKNDNSIMTSVTQHFTTKLSSPILIAPQNESTGIALNPELSWEDMNGADTYKLEVNNDSTFNGAVIFSENINTNSVQLEALDENTTYFWKVTVENDLGNYSDKSEVFSFTTIDPTSITDESIPSEYNLSQNFPNPFNPSTVIEYDIPKSTSVKITLYNSLGQQIRTLVNRQHAPGYYSFTIDGSELSSGVYLYRIITDEFSKIKKMVLIR